MYLSTIMIQLITGILKLSFADADQLLYRVALMRPDVDWRRKLSPEEADQFLNDINHKLDQESKKGFSSIVKHGISEALNKHYVTQLKDKRYSVNHFFGFKFDALTIIERLQQLTHYQKNEVAEFIFKKSPQALNQQTRRNHIDIVELARWCVINHVDLHWLVTGISGEALFSQLIEEDYVCYDMSRSAFTEEQIKLLHNQVKFQQELIDEYLAALKKLSTQKHNKARNDNPNGVR